MSVVKIRAWLATLLLLVLVGCGGGSSGDAGAPLLGGTTSGSSAAKVEVSTSNGTLGDGDSVITVTAIVKDANNVGLPNTPLTWAVTTGNLTGAATSTNVDGKAVATFSAKDRSAGSATITAKSGNAQGEAVVGLEGVRSVVVSSSAPQVGTDGGTVTVTAVVKDPNNVAIGGAAVSWKADIGSLTNQQSVTNAQGVATATYSPGSTVVQPTATITAMSATYSGSAVVQVSPTTTSVELLAAQPSIGTGGDQVQISAFVKDANNIAKVGAAVTWSVDKGRISSQAQVTDGNGVARAMLDAGSDKSNRTAVVSVVSGAARQTLSVPIVNTKLTYSGPTTTTVGSTVKLTITAADSKQVVIPGATLAVSSSLGNAVASSATTDSAGQVTLDYGATRSGADTISVTGLGATAAVAMTVTGTDEDLTFVAPPASSQVEVGKATPLTLRYRKSGVPQAGVTVNFAATIGVLSKSSDVTDANGQIDLNVQSTFAGSSLVSATIQGSAVQATLPLNFVATTPATLVLQVSPTALGPNLAGGTTQQATLYAKVTDPNGNPVAGTTVNFSQIADPSGGVLQQASAVTDLNGVATVQYLSGAESTASGAVQLRGTVAKDPKVFGGTALTVSQSALFIAIGTGNTISNFNPETYEKNWTVYVTDANGVRVTNVPVTIKVIPNYFAKGMLAWSDVAAQWTYVTYRECPNEDGAANPGRTSATDPSPIWSTATPLPAGLSTKPADFNANGKLDAGEDLNGDGSLTPGNMVALSASTLTTDSNGTATITMRYAELFASWIGVRLTATAIVAGTESSTFKDFPLDKLASDYNQKTVAPAGVLSPFGVDVGTCTNAN
ncbi:MAG: Ig-like domain-containing protein [Burkholderiaceae bacterium]|nr:Ig-like domain-containing protein [Burkholderiaceae bacterium]